MALSTLTVITQIPERSDATPGLWNARFTQIDANFASVQTAINSVPYNFSLPPYNGSVQAAINAAVASGGGEVTGNPATYTLSSQVTIGSNVRLRLPPGMTFTSTLTGANLPVSMWKVSGSSVVVDGVRQSNGTVGNLTADLTKGWGIELASGVSDVEITHCDLRYFAYAVKPSGTYSNIRVHDNTWLSGRVDLAFVGIGVYGDRLRISDNECLGNRAWTAPYASAGAIHVAGGLYYFEGSNTMTDTIYDTQAVDKVWIERNVIGAMDGRPIAVVNATAAKTKDNISRQSVGYFATAGVSDDMVTYDLVRGGEIVGNDLYGGGENTIDILSCQHLTCADNTIQKCNTTGILVSPSDQYAANPGQTLSKTKLQTGNIVVEHNTIEAFYHLAGGLGSGVRLADNICIPYPASSNFTPSTSSYVPWFAFLGQGDQFLIAGQGVHAGASSATSLVVAAGNFSGRGVTSGMTVNNLTTGSFMTVLSLSTLTTLGDTITGHLSSGVWSLNDRFEIPAMANPSLRMKDWNVKGNTVDFGPPVQIASVNTASDTFVSVGPHGLTTGEAVEFEWGGDTHQIILPTGPSTGSHTGAAGAAFLTDANGNFLARGVRAGHRVRNTTDGSSAVITTVSATTVGGALAGGSGNSWASGATYQILLGHTDAFFVTSSTTTGFKLASSFTLAIAGTALDLTDPGNSNGTSNIVFVVKTNPNRLWLDGLSMPWCAHLDTLLFDEVFSQHQDFLFSSLVSTAHNNLGQGRTITAKVCLDPFVDYFPGNQRGFKSFLQKWLPLPPFHYDGTKTVGLKLRDHSRLETFFSSGSSVHDSTMIAGEVTVRVFWS